MGASSIFIWKPDFNQINSSLQYRTDITFFESGIEQRRYKSALPKYISNLTFQKYLSSRGVIGDIWEFYKDRKGQYDWFWLPSFKHDTFLTVNAFSGQDTITVDNVDRFTDNVDTHGNYIYLNNGTNQEIRQIASIASTVLTLANVLTYNYVLTSIPGSIAWIQIAYKVRFDNDEYTEDNFADFLYEAGITFQEVFFPDN